MSQRTVLACRESSFTLLTFPGFGTATATGGCCEVELGGGGGPPLVGKGRESELPARLWLGGVTWGTEFKRIATAERSIVPGHASLPLASTGGKEISEL